MAMISRPRLVALALTAAAVVTQLRVGSADVLEQVLVKVNGDILTKTELEAKQIAAIRGRINSAVDADSMKNDDTLKKMIAEVTPKILVDTIDEMLLIQLGKEKGYHVTDQQFKDWLTQLRKDQNLDDENKFKAALAQEGMTMDDLRKNFEKQVTVYRVQQDEVGQKLQITEEEARQYYLAHQSEFVEAPTVTLGEISQPVRGAKNWQIFKLEKLTTPVTQPFESVRDLVAEKVYASRQQAEVKKFLGRLRSQALIVWKNDTLKKAYEDQLRTEEPGIVGGH